MKSYQLVKDIYLSTSTFPKDERFGLTSQVRRAAVSIPVNIAEGAARRGSKEFIQFLYISLGSMAELDTLLYLSTDFKYLPVSTANKYLDELDVIGKLIYGLIRKLQLG